MSGSARLTEIEAVPQMEAALRCFAEEARAALTELDMRIRRALDWVQHDQAAFWAEQVRRGQHRIAEARVNLERAMLTRRVADHQPSCREEKMALEGAKRRLRAAQEKVETVKRWSRTLDHEATEYRGAINQLGHWLDGDFFKAVANLEGMRRALETYIAIPTMEQSLATGDGLPTASTGLAESSPPVEDVAGAEQGEPGQTVDQAANPSGPTVANDDKTRTSTEGGACGSET